MVASQDGARGSAVCLCFLFIWAIFAVASPFWLWRWGWTWNGATVTIASGSYVVSSLSGAVRCGWWTTCVLQTQWNYFDDFNNTLCYAEFFDTVGQYGFCSSEATDNTSLTANDLVQTPQIIVNMQALAVTTVVCLGLAMVFACVAPEAGGAMVASLATLLTLTAFCTSTAAYGLAVSYEYYQKFGGAGWFLPFTGTGSCSTDRCLIFSDRVAMGWGPAFGGMVLVSITTFFLTLSMCATTKVMRDEVDKDYKNFDEREQGGGPTTEETAREPTLA